MAIIGIVMTPVYIRMMGIESYGLIGFYTMLQAWFQLFDLGFSATMGRQTAQFNGGGSSATELQSLFKALQYLFFAIVCLIGVLSGYASQYIAHTWIKTGGLALTEIEKAMQLILIVVALRWMSGLYRGVISGFEAQIWLNKFNIFFASLKFVGVIFVFNFVDKTVSTFFIYQLSVTALETLILILYGCYLMPKVDSAMQIKWRALRSVLPFSLNIAFTSSIWVFVTQLDKLILSKLLTLDEYGCFSLAVVVTSGINALITPISAAILPRLTRLSAENEDLAFINLYNNVTQLVSVLTASVSVILIFFAEKVLYAWTGNVVISIQAASVLRGYAIGSSILAITALPYYLQFAKGNVRLHSIGNFLFALFMLPLLCCLTSKWKANGAGYAWALSNALYFLLWTPIVHRSFLGKFHVNWILRNIGVIYLPVVCFSGLLSYAIVWSQSRWILSVQLVSLFLGLIVIASLQSKFIRNYILCIQWRKMMMRNFA